VKHVLVTESLTGPVNIVSPNPATNRQFTKALGRALGRLTVLPVPAAMVRLVLGQMADELLLASVRAVPKKLLESGFTFRHPEIAEALRAILQR
jgi:NAD dependent epimerase/dehydratase family enzyme